MMLGLIPLLMLGCKDAPESSENIQVSSSEDGAPQLEKQLPPAVFPLANPVALTLKDQSAGAEQTRPWDNYRQQDLLYEKYVEKGLVTANPRPPGWERYKQDFMGAMLRDGKISYAIVHLLYREGYLERSRRAELVDGLLKRVKAADNDHALKANLILSLIHIGFDKEALEFIQTYQNEPWFQSNWDVNFYAGTMLFRYQRYAEARPFLERAQSLHPALLVGSVKTFAVGNATAAIDDFAKFWP